MAGIPRAPFYSWEVSHTLLKVPASRTGRRGDCHFDGLNTLRKGVIIHMADIKNTFESSNYGDRLEPADRLKLERHIYMTDEKTDISRLTVLPLERLQELRERSAAAEQELFDSLRGQADLWDKQAAVTLLINKAIEYSKVPAVVHSSNQWVKDNVNSDRQSMSNMVYKMAYHINEKTSYNRAAGKSAPSGYELRWDIYTNNPGQRRFAKIAGQEKSFADKADMDKYLAGRIKAYAHLFTEISPPVPPEYKKGFSVNGQLLPGYTVQGEKPTDRAAADIGGVSIVDQKINDLLRKEQENMNEPLNIKLSTREQYEAGSVEGAWLKLPAAAEQLNAALARIGAQGKDIVISDIESPIAAISRIPLENVQNAGLDELNFLAARLEMFGQEHIGKLNAASEIMTHRDDVHHLIEYTFCPEFYDFHPDIKTNAELGEFVFEKSGMIQIPEAWAGAVDREKLGQLAAEEEHGVFTEQGYIVESGIEGTEWYSIDKNDIPQEYRIAPEIEKPGRGVDMKTAPDVAANATAITEKPPEQKQAAAFVPIVLTSENPRDRMKEITDKLEAGIKGIFNSDKYKDYLQTLSKFHNYSFNNCILIAMQKPDASHVAGFNDWRDNFKRQVKKGEKGIKILAPAPFKTKKMLDAVDADGKPVFDGNGRRKKEEKEITVPAFKIVSVFDVSQTDGEPLPQIGVDELTGNVDRYKELFAAIEKTSPVPISFEALAPDVKGTYYQIDKRIAVNEGMSELQNLKTLVHEIAHARLHDIDENAPKDTIRPDRDTREVQAESIAYAVCLHYGLDTSGYSFGYVAEWSGGKELDILKSSLDTIRKEASAIITEVDKHFAELTQEQEQTAPAPERQPGFENWSEPATPENAPDNPGAPSDDVNKYLPRQDAPEPQGDSFTIYQLKGGDETRDLRFAEFAALTTAGLAVAVANYDKIYSAPLDSGVTLDDIYMDFNMDRPEGFTGHSLSVSDVIVINKDRKETAHYVDNIGFQELPDFLTPREQAQEKPAPSIDLKAVADFMQKQYDYAKGADPDSQAAVATVSIITRRLNAANERIPDNQPQLKALIADAAQSTDLPMLKERMNTLHTEFIQHYSTAVQNTADMSGKAEPTLPKETLSDHIADITVSIPPAPKAPAQGENVAAIEAKVKAGEVINLSDLTDAMKKDKAAAQTSKATPQSTDKNPNWKAAHAQDSWDRAQGKNTKKPAEQEKPSIREELAANKKQLAAQKSAPTKTQNKNAAIGE